MADIETLPANTRYFTEVSAPSTPSSGQGVLYAATDGTLHYLNDAATDLEIGSGGGGDVATDAIWDAAGDLAVGSGADTAAKLTLGATGTVPESNGSALAYAYPPGYEFDYTEFTSAVNLTATSAATADTIVTAGAFAGDGTTSIVVEFFCVSLDTSGSASPNWITVVLYDGGSSIGTIGIAFIAATTAVRMPAAFKRKLTPSAASHTYSIRAYVNGGTGSAAAGAGGSGNNVPGFVRVWKA